MDLGVRYTELVLVVHATTQTKATPQVALGNATPVTGADAPSFINVAPGSCDTVVFPLNTPWTHFRFLLESGTGFVAVYGIPR